MKYCYLWDICPFISIISRDPSEYEGMNIYPFLFVPSCRLAAGRGYGVSIPIASLLVNALMSQDIDKQAGFRKVNPTFHSLSQPACQKLNIVFWF